MYNISQKYIPLYLSKKDKLNQKNMILKSRKLYKSKKYFTRKNVPSFKTRPSKHIINAKRIYNIDKISPSRELAKKTGCSLQALNKIVKKGEGAYYSSGSRPNQTPQSWGLARLASAVTGGKASRVDFSILKEGCSHTGKAYRLAKKA
jgi:DNA-binding Xre family transcriptional regulator